MKLEAEGCITSISLVFMKLTLAGFQYAIRRGEMKHSSFSWCAAEFLHSLGMLAAAELRGDSQGPAPQAGGKPEVPQRRCPCCQQRPPRREVWSVWKREQHRMCCWKWNELQVVQAPALCSGSAHRPCRTCQRAGES